MVSFSPAEVVSVKPEENTLLTVPLDPPAAGPDRALDPPPDPKPPAGLLLLAAGGTAGTTGGGGDDPVRTARDHDGRGSGRDEPAACAGKHLSDSCPLGY